MHLAVATSYTSLCRLRDNRWAIEAIERQCDASESSRLSSAALFVYDEQRSRERTAQSSPEISI